MADKYTFSHYDTVAGVVASPDVTVTYNATGLDARWCIYGAYIPGTSLWPRCLPIAEFTDNLDTLDLAKSRMVANNIYEGTVTNHSGDSEGELLLALGASTTMKLTSVRTEWGAVSEMWFVVAVYRKM
jgi:hypothetical protein